MRLSLAPGKNTTFPNWLTRRLVDKLAKNYIIVAHTPALQPFGFSGQEISGGTRASLLG